MIRNQVKERIQSSITPRSYLTLGSIASLLWVSRPSVRTVTRGPVWQRETLCTDATRLGDDAGVLAFGVDAGQCRRALRVTCALGRGLWYWKRNWNRYLHEVLVLRVWYEKYYPHFYFGLSVSEDSFKLDKTIKKFKKIYSQIKLDTTFRNRSFQTSNSDILSHLRNPRFQIIEADVPIIRFKKKGFYLVYSELFWTNRIAEKTRLSIYTRERPWLSHLSSTSQTDLPRAQEGTHIEPDDCSHYIQHWAHMGWNSGMGSHIGG